MTASTLVPTADGCEVMAYDFYGEGDPLLFVHATGFHAHMWLPVIEHLRDRFHCFAFDVRAHGASPTPVNGDFRWRTMADDARDVAAAFDLNTPLAVGHSAGGAQLIMAQQDHPGSWASIWAFEPVVPAFPSAPPGVENPMAEAARRRRRHFESRDTAYDNFASKPAFAAFDPAALRLYVDYGFVDDPAGGVTLACTGEDEAKTYNGALDGGTFDRLGEVKIPVHVACGETSTHFSPVQMKLIAESLPDATLEVIPALGHFGPFENPRAVAASIADALG